MLVRLLAKSVWRQKARTTLILLSVTTASALVTAFLSIASTITERMARELRSFGANILLVPRAEPLEVEIAGLKYVPAEEAAYLEESNLAKIKTIFWRHNIVAFAPFLSRTVEIEGRRVLFIGTWFEKEIAIPEGKRSFTFGGGSQREVAPEKEKWRTGLKALSPWWEVEGRWVGDEEEAVVIGSALAEKLKVRVDGLIRLSYEARSASLPVRGIVKSGGTEAEQIFVPLQFAQELFGLPGKVDRVQVSALVTPDNALAVRANRIGPSQLPPEEYETWYCTSYLSSIIYQLEEAIPQSKGKAIRQVSEAESAFLLKMRLTFMLLVAISLFVASLGVIATMMTAVFERRHEIGLMKALGAEEKQIGLLFLLEATLGGLVGGLLGYVIGLALAQLLAARTFAMADTGLPLSLQWVILLVTLVLAVGVALFGSFFPVRGAMRLDPVRALRE